MKLNITLSGDAERQFKEMCRTLGVDGRTVILDSLAVLHAMMEAVLQGDRLVISDPLHTESREISTQSLDTLRGALQRG